MLCIRCVNYTELTQRTTRRYRIYTSYTSFSGLLHNTAISGVDTTITPRFLSVGMAYDIIAVSDIIAVMILFDPPREFCCLRATLVRGVQL